MKKGKDSLGDRMKKYENITRYKLMDNSFTAIRLDGRAFKTLTKGLNKPFDLDFMDAMAKTMLALCSNLQNVKYAYVQSDEISIVMTDFDHVDTSAWFDNDVRKIVSISASEATAEFNKQRLIQAAKQNNNVLTLEMIEKLKYGKFDSRVWTLPTALEVFNYFYWRQEDCVRNSIQSVAQSKFSPKELDKKNIGVLQEMMFQKDGTNWNNLPDEQKRGFMCVRQEVEMKPGVVRNRWVIVPSERLNPQDKDSSSLMKILNNI